MRFFLAFFAMAVMLLAASAFVAANMLDVAGFEALLAARLGAPGLALTTMVALVGTAFSIATGVLYVQVVQRRNYDSSERLGLLAVIGVTGLVLAYVSLAVLCASSGAGLSTSASILRAVDNLVLGGFGVAIPAIAAATGLLAVPLSLGWERLMLWAMQPPQRKVAHRPSRVVY